MPTRRTFLRRSVAALAAPALLGTRPRRLPLGIQLYSVREYLATDYGGTLKQLSALGYRQVEAAGFFNLTAEEVREAMQQAGLSCVSAHYLATELYTKLDEILEFALKLGLRYLVCSLPAVKNPARLPDLSYDTVSKSFVLEDWHYNAEQFNLTGAKIRQAGMRFAYHNHTLEFRAVGGNVPYDILMRETNAESVWFELDCGWVEVGGGNAQQILRQHGRRISMLHLKDFRSFTPSGPDREAIPTEMGRGLLDNSGIIAASRSAALEHIFVEQEGFDIPWVESLRADADWLRKYPGA
jgi:sugar phosphate isomerase/epimerase